MSESNDKLIRSRALASIFKKPPRACFLDRWRDKTTRYERNKAKKRKKLLQTLLSSQRPTHKMFVTMARRGPSWFVILLVGGIVLGSSPLFLLTQVSIVPQHYAVFPYLMDGMVTRNPSRQQDKDADTADLDKNEITLVDLPNSDAVFLHMGKAAGGSIAERGRDLWGMRIKECHPQLCSMATEFPNSTNLLISLRDPIDRFVSAYYWRLYVVCDPDGDKRQRAQGASHNPEQFCKRKATWSIKNLFRKFNRNASQLAEALCSSDPQLANLAQATMPQVHHSQIWIRDWLDFDWQPERMFALVAERNTVELEPQIDTAMEWLYNRTQFESLELFRARQRRVQEQRHVADLGKFAHSSAGAQQTKHPLSLRAQQCLASHYRQDYELLRDKKEVLCKTQDCLRGIQAILDRRLPLLAANVAPSTIDSATKVS